MAIYMQIPHQKGVVTTQSHHGWIAVLGFSFSAERTIQDSLNNTSNRILSAAHVTEAMIYKSLDGTSPFFFSEACVGKAISKISIDVIGESGSPLVKYKLDNAIVSEYDSFIIADDIPIEAVSFNFTHLEMIYISYEQGIAKPIAVKLQTGSKPRQATELKQHIKNRSNEGFKMFVATLYGEAANESEVACQAIASVVINRVDNKRFVHGPKGDRKKLTSPFEVIQYTGFDAYTRPNKPYYEALKYLNNPSEKMPPRLNKIVNLLKPIYFENRLTTDAVIYYSPKAQHTLHLKFPDTYREKPDLKFNELVEVKVPGLLSTDDFLFFKYK